MSRITIFAYGVLSYLVFFAVFLYGIGFIGGFSTPTSLDGVPTTSLAHALTVDLALLAAFALQHSGMARPAFKAWWKRFVPEAAERSTYVLLSSLALAALYIYWEPIGGVIWSAQDGVVRNGIIGLYLLGWLLLLYTTFLIDHFDLFGLKQVWRRLFNKTYRAPVFRTPSLYKVVRHPLYIGWLTIFWAAPTMTVSHLIFALATTAYILIAIRFEEHDLVSAFGTTYVDYRARTPMLIPRLWSRGAKARRAI
ncbi:MAG TPA: isoprenylcysteine carboxylmethyltransferase family protein [Steroidobacteraceae bacterium]|nr:isoprenylcysteine carboxylmethyltransferase family protein [Steroidobacteraceae bacterium]